MKNSEKKNFLVRINHMLEKKLTMLVKNMAYLMAFGQKLY